jgi:eukaryotic-like serine/threonine-protein kinase
MEPLDTIFLTARDIVDPIQRAAYVADACGADGALRARIEELLKHYQAAEDYFGSHDSAPAQSRAMPVSERPGALIGRYKLLEKIGEGGMGIVYMAEQREPVKRRVALKVIKVGMDTKQVVARFEAERQALAMMDHPNIAKVFDGGESENGPPYFVMELVRGIPITKYCDENNLTTRQRLELFLSVCNAIQHAHQKGIIHRDIKPSNVLVTLHDGEPVPKVIDFGIAKATQQELTEKTIFTQFHQMIGTPAYMSPEQAEMSGLDIDTRSDLYSLGVLLYELLVGKTPLDTAELIHGGFDEIRRRIREEEPVRPSTRLKTLQEEERTTTAKQRKLDPSKLGSDLRGDLDWIVMKTLEKDRRRRYETVNGLTLDIQRHLNNEAVLARPPSKSYRFQKLVRRNKLAFAAGGAVTVTLLIGLGLSTWLFLKERASRQRAVSAERAKDLSRQKAEANERKALTEAARSQQVAQFLKEMLESANPSIALGRDTTILREILDKAIERIGKELKDQPEVEADLRSTIANTYFGLGDFQIAANMNREALRLRKSVSDGVSESVADSLTKLGASLEELGALSEAESVQREALEMMRKLFGNQNTNVAYSLTRLSSVLRSQGRSADAEMPAREAVMIWTKEVGDVHPALAYALNQLGSALLANGKAAEVEVVEQQAIAMWRSLGLTESQGMATSLQTLGSVRMRQHQWSEAEVLLRECITIRRKLLGTEHKWVSAAAQGLALSLANQGKLAEAESLWREALRIRRKTPGNTRVFSDFLANLAVVLRAQGRVAEAERTYREASAISQELIEDAAARGDAGFLNAAAWILATSGDPTLRDGQRALILAEKAVAMTNGKKATYLDTLAVAQAETGQFAEAMQTEREVIRLLEDKRLREGAEARLKLFASNTPYRDTSLAAEAGDLLATGIAHMLNEEKFAEAEALARECLAIRKAEDSDHWKTFESQSLLGACLLGQQRWAEAEPLLLTGYEGMKQHEDKIPPTEKAVLRAAAGRVLKLYEAWGKPESAAQWRAKVR